MSRRRKGQDNNGGGGAPGWMTTFADLMSLLLTFFILLYSMSNIDAEKFRSVSSSLQGVLSGSGGTGILEGQGTIVDLPVETSDSERESNLLNIDQRIYVMEEKVLEYISQEGLNSEVSVNVNERGVYVDIKETILFDSGSASIKESGYEVLNKLVGLINSIENDIVIEGHTDNVPSRTRQFPSNWELSTSRAVSVLRYLSEVKNVDPRRLSAVGYGEYSPIAPNDTPENRSLNRRVNILIILNEESDEVNG